jgi:hypothetical protein
MCHAVQVFPYGSQGYAEQFGELRCVQACSVHVQVPQYRVLYGFRAAGKAVQRQRLIRALTHTYRVKVSTSTYTLGMNIASALEHAEVVLERAELHACEVCECGVVLPGILFYKTVYAPPQAVLQQLFFFEPRVKRYEKAAPAVVI